MRARSAVVRSLRDSLHRRDYLEVETPALQLLHGGASARPFVTHSNALDVDLYLRIATELYLKRLIVGGLERVYEIAKNFRNEGMDRNHSPEFTMMEWYEAYSDYEQQMEYVEQLIQQLLAPHLLHELLAAAIETGDLLFELLLQPIHLLFLVGQVLLLAAQLLFALFRLVL